MPNFDRLIKVLFLEGEPDRVPFYDLFADPEITEAIIGEDFRMYEIPVKYEMAVSEIPVKKELKDSIKFYLKQLKASIKFYLKLGYDYVSLPIPSPFFRDNILLAKDTAELARPKRAWQDENRGVIETREDFNRYSWPDLNEIQETYLPVYEFVKGNLPDGMMIIPLTPGGVLENVMWLMGAVPFFRALYRDPILIRDMFEKVEAIISYICKLASEGEMVGAMAMGDDMGYKNGPMMSLENFRKYVFPWQKKCADAVHKHGKPFIFHSCGNLKLLMGDLINYVGIDAKHSYEDTSYPVIEYKKAYGDRIAILGGVDMDKLSRMPKKEFQTYVLGIIHECAPGGGYALGCGNSVANYIKLENYLTMLEIGKKYGKYPIKV